MVELRIERRMATWWQCAMLLALVAFFAWVIREGLRSTSPDVYGRVIIPPYFLLLYATVAALVNRRKLVVTPDVLVMSNGPVVLGVTVRVPRDHVAFAYHQAITTTDDNGGEIVIQHVAGVVTKAGGDLPVVLELKDEESALAAAQEIAGALAGGPVGPAVPVRRLDSPAEYPVDYRAVWIWIVLIAAAVIVGIGWEIAHRWGL